MLSCNMLTGTCACTCASVVPIRYNARCLAFVNYEGNDQWSVFQKKCLIVEAKLIETSAW